MSTSWMSTSTVCPIADYRVGVQSSGSVCGCYCKGFQSIAKAKARWFRAGRHLADDPRDSLLLNVALIGCPSLLSYFVVFCLRTGNTGNASRHCIKIKFCVLPRDGNVLQLLLEIEKAFYLMLAESKRPAILRCSADELDVDANL